MSNRKVRIIIIRMSERAARAVLLASLEEEAVLVVIIEVVLAAYNSSLHLAIAERAISYLRACSHTFAHYFCGLKATYYQLRHIIIISYLLGRRRKNL
jgi:hypothetical protein